MTEPQPAVALPAARVVAAPAEVAVKAAEDASDNHGLAEVDARRIDLYWSGGMVAGILLIFLTLSLVKGVSMPVLLALAMAYALNPIVTWLSTKRVKRTLATALVFAFLAVAFVGFSLYLIPTLGAQAAKLPSFLKAAATQLIPWVETTFSISVPDLLHERANQLGDEASKLASEAGPAIARMLAGFASNTARVVTAVLGLLVVPVIGFFFLADYPNIVGRFQRLIPLRARSLVSRRFTEVDDVLSALVRGQLTVGAILSGIYALGLSFAAIDMAILIALIAGFGNMVPYLGTGIAVVLAVIGVVLSWQGPWQLAVIAGTFIFAQVLEGLVITPRVVGQKVGLPPVVVIIAVLAFAELFGCAGVLLAVPLTAVLKVVFKVVMVRYRRSRLYLAGSPTP